MLRLLIPPRRKAKGKGAKMEVSYFLKKRNTNLRTLLGLKRKGAGERDDSERQVMK
jgi:hypothetical protein